VHLLAADRRGAGRMGTVGWPHGGDFIPCIPRWSVMSRIAASRAGAHPLKDQLEGDHD
jgi:hypothetical protein